MIIPQIPIGYVCSDSGVGQVIFSELGRETRETSIAFPCLLCPTDKKPIDKDRRMTTMNTPRFLSLSLQLLLLSSWSHGFLLPQVVRQPLLVSLNAAAATTWFGTEEETTSTAISLDKQKAALLQLGAALDRGQSYNPTSGEYVSVVFCMECEN
jgi:hypothetical protein